MDPNQDSTAGPSNSNDRKKREREAGNDVNNRITLDVENYHTGKITLEEVCDKIFKIVGAEEYLDLRHLDVFTIFMIAAANKGKSDVRILPKFGHILSYYLHKMAKEDQGARYEILKGVAVYCGWSAILIDRPSIWAFVGEVLVNAILPTPGIFEGAPPTLGDFKNAFLQSAKDTRKPYALFVQVLKRLEEIHCMREKGKYYSDAARKVYGKMTYWVAITVNREDFQSIIKEMDADKLTDELKKTKTNFNCNLYTILHESGCL